VFGLLRLGQGRSSSIFLASALFALGQCSYLREISNNLRTLFGKEMGSGRLTEPRSLAVLASHEAKLFQA
jgi:hypothetical protein